LVVKFAGQLQGAITSSNLPSSVPYVVTVNNDLNQINTVAGLFYNGVTNSPTIDPTSNLTTLVFPWALQNGFGNQLSFERYGKLYTRNYNSGSNFGRWKQIAQFLEATTTYDAPSIASMGTTTTTIAVTGAVLGNYGHVAFGISLQGIIATAYVSAADVVTIVLFNPTGAAIDLASTTVKAKAE